MDGSGDEARLHVEAWPTSEGRLHFLLLDGAPPSVGVEAALAQLAPGSAVVTEDAGVREGLLERGARQVRHVLAMKREVATATTASAVEGLVLRSWRSGDAELLAPALVGAYDAQHPDAMSSDLAAAAQRLSGVAEDPDNPRLRATTVAELGGRPVGAALVLRSEHVEGWKGPWVMNVFRAPDPALPGVGRAMLVRALDVLREDGETQLGLAVTATNPARRVYESLGFTYGYDGWVLVLPGGDEAATSH